MDLHKNENVLTQHPEGAFVRSKVNSYLCNWSIKENYNLRMIAPLDFQKAKHVIKQPKVISHRYHVVLPRRGKCWSLHVPPHQEK